MNSSISSRLSALRIFLKDHGLNGWIVPTADPHLSEYVDEHYAFRKWLSGFTGSAGSLLVTQDAASACHRLPLLGSGRAAARGLRH